MKYCPRCGTQLYDSVNVCTFCGLSQSFYGMQHYEKAKINVFSLLGFILGLASLMFNFCGITGVAAIVLSVIALCKKDFANNKSKPFAIAGLVTGIIGALIGIFYIIALIYLYPVLINEIKEMLRLTVGNMTVK